MATLKVKYLSGPKLTLTNTNGEDPLEMDAGDELEIGYEHLVSTSFREPFLDGRIRIVNSPHTAERAKLARQVIPELIEALAGEMLALHAAATSSKANLAKMRAQYNGAHAATLAVLESGDDFVDGAKNLEDTVDHWRRATVEKEALDDALEAIEDHVAAGVVAPQTFEEWYEQLLDFQAEHQRAEISYANAKANIEDRMAPIVSALDSAAQDFEANKAAAKHGIGDTIPTWPAV